MKLESSPGKLSDISIKRKDVMERFKKDNSSDISLLITETCVLLKTSINRTGKFTL
jgi:hypothetical protein